MKNKITFVLLFAVSLLSVVSAYSDSNYIENYDLQINYDGALAGEVFTLQVSVINDDNSLRNFTLDFDDDSPFDFLTDEKWEFTLNSSQSISKNFRIEIDDDADSKKYDLDFNLDDGDDDWDDSFEIRVSTNDAEFVLGEISSTPSKIFPGEEDALLSVFLENEGDLVAENVVAEMILPRGFTPSSSYSNIVHLGDLDSGEVANLDFYFDVDKSVVDSSVANIILNYEVDGEEMEKELSVDIAIFAMPQFEIMNVQTLNEEITKGSTSKVKIQIENVGGEDASDVTLKVYERSDQPFVYEEKSYYIGSLIKGEIGEAVFEFSVDSDAEPISYFVDFQVRSVLGDSVFVDDLTTSFSVVEKQNNFNLIFLFTFFAVLIVAGVLIYLFRRS